MVSDEYDNGWRTRIERMEERMISLFARMGVYDPAVFGGGTSNTGASRAAVTMAIRPN